MKGILDTVPEALLARPYTDVQTGPSESATWRIAAGYRDRGEYLSRTEANCLLERRVHRSIRRASLVECGDGKGSTDVCREVCLGEPQLGKGNLVSSVLPRREEAGAKEQRGLFELLAPVAYHCLKHGRVGATTGLRRPAAVTTRRIR